MLLSVLPIILIAHSEYQTGIGFPATREIELALMRLYHHTNETRYLELAKWFLDQRGHGYGKGAIWDQWKDPAYCQDEVPVKDQKKLPAMQFAPCTCIPGPLMLQRLPTTQDM